MVTCGCGVGCVWRGSCQDMQLGRSWTWIRASPVCVSGVRPLSAPDVGRSIQIPPGWSTVGDGKRSRVPKLLKIQDSAPPAALVLVGLVFCWNLFNFLLVFVVNPCHLVPGCGSAVHGGALGDALALKWCISSHSPE